MSHAITKPTKDIARAGEQLGAHALGYPGVTEEHPWGHRAMKVNRKTFVFLYTDATGLSISVKLPESGQLALELPFAEPTGYGLGKSGWVSAKFPPGKPVPLPLLREWIDESFRAIAPRKVVAGLATAAKHPEKAPRARAPAPRKRAKAPTKRALSAKRR